MKNKWKEAIIHELIVCGILNKEHYDNPRKAVRDAILWNVEVAEFFANQNKWNKKLKNSIINAWYRTPIPFWLWKACGSKQPPF
jgi:hypothetical protein